MLLLMQYYGKRRQPDKLLQNNKTRGEKKDNRKHKLKNSWGNSTKKVENDKEEQKTNRAKADKEPTTIWLELSEFYLSVCTAKV